jgi:hypothetical protein
MVNSWHVWERKNEVVSNCGKTKIIVDVLYVLGFNKKLLSVGTITYKGNNSMVLDFGKCLVIQNKDPNIIVAKGVKDIPKNGLYKLEVHYEKLSQEVVETCIVETCTWRLWTKVKPCFGIGKWHTFIIKLSTQWVLRVYQLAS